MSFKSGFKVLDVFFVVFAVLLCSMFGYFHMPAPGGVVGDERVARGAVLLFSFSMVSIFYYLYIGRLKFNLFTRCIFLVIVYSVFVAFAWGRLGDSVSYAIRLLTFALLVDLSYREFLRRESWQKVIQGVLLGVLFVFVFQVVHDQSVSNVVFMNGAYRHSASVGSPIGLATALSVISFGLLACWLKTQSKYFLMLSLLSTFLIFLTATRSISILMVLVICSAIFLNSNFTKKAMLVVVMPFVLWVMVQVVPNNFGLSDRIYSLVDARGLDASGLFRLFIVDTYFSNISLYEVVVGLGLGSFPVWFSQKTGIVGVAPHFEWLWLLSELGVIVFVCYFIVLFYMLFAVGLLAWKRRSAFLLFLGFGALGFHQLIFQLSNPLYFYQVYIPFSLLFGWFLASFKLYKAGQGRG